MLGIDEIKKRFGSTATNPVGTEVEHNALRLYFIHLAEHIDQIMPDGREKSVALTELEMSSMWAHKGLANFFRDK
jgi:hypothetical protein